MNRLTIIILTLLAAGLLSCKAFVTETGNPCPGGDCPATAPAGGGGDGGEDGEESETMVSEECDDTNAALMVYGDPSVGFELGYPACWVYTAMDSGEGYSTINLTDNRNQPSTAAIEARRRDAWPSLISLITEANGDCAPTEYDTGKIKGYLCDKAAPGAGGSDWRIYYFLKGDLLLLMSFELFPGGEVGATRILGSLVMD